ncbi:methyltransferase domain-containing protein [Methylobacterium sp. WL12]|uniref:class I SAM-dependent methyltransferase n=1 Tax=Methylobacterium sp. WL12 TaxID=2603890 RepID=UPI0011C6FEC5|nr:class I SAM-dependent methyltransferase [Methylobacterium sp. WL12]TXM67545.1 methyltransferase domain-containing protein [Methylobacterium sp. WL12]
MTAWTEGYVSDIPYALGFYRETTPNHLAFAAACVGANPGGALAPKRVLELGFGMGLGFVLAAAANPATHFEGVDFNPQHVAHARGLADAAGLQNIVIAEASFQDVAREAQEGQHDLDLIVLHGILTWVSAEAHMAIVEIARKRLKPGGLLYVSYNAMPGWAHVLPLQRLMRENAKRVSGRSDQQTVSGIELVKALSTEGARYFDANPNLAQRVEKLSGMDPNYLAHEYLNANWFIFHVADVADMFGKAKLGYLGSATLSENIDVVSVPEGMRQRVAAATDPIWRETLRDYASNKQFRRDIYARGLTALTSPESRSLLGKMRFALAVPRNKVTFKFSGALGEIAGNEGVYGPVADLLSTRISSFAEIATLPAVEGAGGWGTALQTVALLVHSGQVLPISANADSDLKPAQRINRIIADKILQGRTYGFLAAPLAGSAIQVGTLDLLMFAAQLAEKAEPDAMARYVVGAMRQLGRNPIKDGVAVTNEAEQIAHVRENAATFLSEQLPVWRRLGVI